MRIERRPGGEFLDQVANDRFPVVRRQGLLVQPEGDPR